MIVCGHRLKKNQILVCFENINLQKGKQVIILNLFLNSLLTYYTLCRDTWVTRSTWQVSILSLVVVWKAFQQYHFEKTSHSIHIWLSYISSRKYLLHYSCVNISATGKYLHNTCEMFHFILQKSQRGSLSFFFKRSGAENFQCHFVYFQYHYVISLIWS